MNSSFAEVCSLLIIFLKIPVTVATAERSFSKLKIINNYLFKEFHGARTTLRLRVVKYRSWRSRTHEHFIDNFANLKPRKVKL